MPPIKNYPLYIWRVTAKWLSFLIFGIGTVVIILMLLPITRLTSRNKADFGRKGRVLIYGSWRYVQIVFMRIVGGVRFPVSREQREYFRHLGGKIVVANHPSLLDIVMLISLIPNADCIVNAELLHNIVRGIVSALYIPNSLEPEEILRRCTASLKAGNCLVIFPEGTRTRRSGPIRVKKGAARIAVRSGCPLVPVRIRGNDKWGLGKKDPWWAYNHTEEYCYELEALPELRPEDYRDTNEALSVKRLNEALKDALFEGQDRQRVISGNA
jgi:1-acyl-sn-glycerol-3-phosphate acyltransferase